MKLRELLSGIASAYVMKGVQLVATIVLLPFLLREEVYGIAGYGRIAAIAALTQMLAVLTDGLRLSLTRRVSQAADAAGGAGEALWNATKFFALVALALSAALQPTAPFLLPLLGIEASRDAVWGLAAALALFFAQNVPFFVRIALINRGAIAFVNHVISAEVVLRTATLLYVLSHTQATLTLYFGIMAGFALVRHVVLWLRLRVGWPADATGWRRAGWRPPREALDYSLPMTGFSLSNLVAVRLPVLLASSLLGAEAAGFVAISLGTIYMYLRQVFLSGLEQILMPIASRMDPLALSSRERTAAGDVEAASALAVGAISAGLIAGMPFLIPLWLGAGYGEVVPAAQLVVLAGCVQIATTIRNALVMGRGWLGDAMRALSIASVAVFGAMVVATWIAGSWLWLVAIAAGFLVVRSAAILGAPFTAHVTPSSDGFRSNRRLVGFVAGAGLLGAASAHGLGAGDAASAALAVGLAGLASTGAGLVVLIGPGRLRRVAAGLRASQQRDLFQRPQPVEPPLD